MPDEREWIIGRYSDRPGDAVVTGVLCDGVRVVPKSSREAAEAERDTAVNVTRMSREQLHEAEAARGKLEAEVERLREALEGAEDFIERVEKWTGSDPDEAHELLDIIGAALSPREDSDGKTEEPMPDSSTNPTRSER